MQNLKGKTVLLLDGTVHMIPILKRAKELGIKTIIANFYEPEKAKAKFYSDEFEVIDITNAEEMKNMMLKHHVDGILQGCTDSHLPYYHSLCQIMGFPCYGTLEQFQLCTDKAKMKNVCRKYGVPVTKEYSITSFSEEETNNIDFPVITKPVDGSGSRGFSICNNLQELKVSYEKAQKYSISGNVLIEKCMDYKKSVIINYTAVNGEIFYSGMSDKLSKKVSEDGSPIMALQFYPSAFEQSFLKETNEKIISMLKGIGIQNGPIWIEAFYDNNEFIFNEIGYRFGGSLTYLPVEYFTGIKQLDLLLEFALTGKNSSMLFDKKSNKEIYCIFPMHLKPGIIKEIKGLDKLCQRPELISFVPTHLQGDIIESSGTTQQVFGYIHFKVKTREDAEKFIEWIVDNLSVTGSLNEQLLFNIYKDRIN